MPASPQWVFERFRLDPDQACLWCAAQAIALPPKAFAVLHYLVTHPDRLVSKDELLDAVWPETAVSDAVVRVAIGALRKALDDTARTPRFIATAPRRGYRFLAPVTMIDPSETGRAGTLLQPNALVSSHQGTGLPAPDVLLPQEGADAWRCTICQYPQSRAARFCVACGAPHVEICRACGQAGPMPATFCPGCGQRLEALPAVPHTPTETHMLDAGQEQTPLAYTPLALAEKIRTSRTALEGEHKQVTVLFADLKDSLELIRDLDPEVAQQLLDPALHAMMDAVHRFEGTVNQVLGDGIMALFGAPIAHEDHAIRACYAALAMQAGLATYAEDVHRVHGVVLQSRIGLNSGEVVVRAIRNDLHMEYSAVGQTTHLAARMEQVAPPGTILLMAPTAQLVTGLVRLKAWGPVPIKGLTEPVEVWELLGVSGMRRRLQIARARGLTRFVGRQTELALLHAVLAQAGVGHGQVVAIVGEAGVGKSRLVDEFVQAAHTQGWFVLDSAAVSYGQATPYFPVLDLLRRYCHLEEREDARAIQTKVTEQILTLDAALQDTVPALLALLDALPSDSPFLQLDPTQRRQHTLAALKRVLLRQSQIQALLLVCEDLHWLDTETQGLLDSLSEGLPTARLLLLVNYRPDYQHGWGGKTYYAQLRLDPLPPVSADTFLQALVGDDSSLAPLTRLLIQRTEGNPFFLEEIVRTLVETGALVGEPGAYRMAHALPTMQMPATVQAVLAARIDRLPTEEKRLLQIAAIIGTEVPLTLLQAVGELSEETLRLSLAHLQDAEFLYEASLFPELVYTFKHALTQEVAYGSLLQEQQRVLHARLVEAIEALYADQVVEQVERLAHHAMRGEVWDKALAYCWQAGEKAMAQSAHREAVRYYEQALRALVPLPETRNTREQAIDLRLALRSALGPPGDDDRRVLVYLREAEDLAVALDDSRRLGQVLRFLAIYLIGECAYEQAMAVGQRALALATVGADGVLQAQANHRLGQAYQARGDYRRAIACFEQTVTLLAGEPPHKHFGDVLPPAVACRARLAMCHAELGMFTEGRHRGEEGLRIVAAENHPTSLILASWGSGLLSLRQGDLPKALPLLERAVSICQAADLLSWFPFLAAALGEAHILGGRVAAAVPLLTRAVELVAATTRPWHLAVCCISLGEAHLLAGRLEQAQAHAERALAHTCAHQERGHQAYALRLLGEIAAYREPLEAEHAEAHYQQALALAEELGMRPLQAHCHRSLGTLYARTGQWEQARAALSTAIALYRVMEMTFWLPQVEATLAEVED